MLFSKAVCQRLVIIRNTRDFVNKHLHGEISTCKCKGFGPLDPQAQKRYPRLTAYLRYIRQAPYWLPEASLCHRRHVGRILPPLDLIGNFHGYMKKVTACRFWIRGLRSKTIQGTTLILCV